MKRILHFFLAALLLISPLSCKKDDPAPASLPSAPEAEAEHNNKSGGIYKGTFANTSSSGVIKIVLQGGAKNIIVTLNGASRTLTTTALNSWTSGDAITAALFNSGDWNVVISITADGSGGDLSLDLAGQTNFGAAIAKETSTAQVKGYEGTYSGDDSGKWNFIIQNGLLSGVYAGGSGSENLSGAAVGNDLTITTAGSVTAVGTLSADGNSTSGTWTTGTSNGMWSGTRKL
jgi:hypothetical protein